MKLHNPVQNEAILSNVGSIGEFRIRNSAKAFNILSSGLYANKIRAIIRELSCNAVDSHTAAGKADTPYDVHLPNSIEPWFSIRDYGTGLSHNEVTNIYTTYFESTKTDSNDFIGALGLGSKSPFSYTDNFTVTAIKNGRKGIYTAFINDQGVPSIALMAETETTDPNGVEVRFAVTDKYDYNKFVFEAINVYEYFKQRPVIHGVSEFKFKDPQYIDRDIVPGVHTISGTSGHSVAIMGNIAYPIEVPHSDNTLGQLRVLLACGLALEFNIGELDFQASREGLSYIPSTIQAIKNKLELLNNNLTQIVATEANNISNAWLRAYYLADKHNQNLWKQAVTDYCTNNNVTFANKTANNFYNLFNNIVLTEDDLRVKYNIRIRGFNKSRSEDKCASLKMDSHHVASLGKYVSAWRISPVKSVHFVVTDTKRGAFDRAKQHWRNNSMQEYSNNVYVLERFDKSKLADFGKFLRDIHNPVQVKYASQLDDKDKKTGVSYGKASILQLTEQYRRRRENKQVWNNAGCLNDYDDNVTYYYIAMNHWECLNTPTQDMNAFVNALKHSGIFMDDIYGVRKSDIEAVRGKSNWVELNGYIKTQLEQKKSIDVMGLVKEAIDYKRVFRHTSSKLNQNGPYYKLYAEFKDVASVDSGKASNITWLLKLYDIKVKTVDTTELIKTYREKVEKMLTHYPMLKHVSYYVDTKDIVDYINMVDTVKGN